MYILTLTLLATGLMWFPYILNAIAVRGLVPQLGYSDALPELSEWAQRAKRAHYNSVENLVIFAPLVIAHYLVTQGQEDSLVSTAAGVYLAARVAHYFFYTAKVPAARTFAFFVGFGAMVSIALRMLGLI